MMIVFMVYLFAVAAHVFIKKKDFTIWFPTILKINLIFCCIAIILFFTPYAEFLWTIRNLTTEMRDFPRLQLLTYEPSYYSLLLAPLAIYYFLKFFLYPTTWVKVISYLLLLILPLTLSFSLGVIAGLLLTFVLFFVLNAHLLRKKRGTFFTIAFILSLTAITLTLLLIFYPENPLYARLVDLMQGKDTSASGRTTNALFLAFQIAERKSLFFGVGLGQIKVVGTEIIREFYNYTLNDIASIRIPNAIGETIAMFGISGLFIRLGLQVYLYFKVKVYTNYYRIAIFTFVFIYQFTGSFFNNSAEIILWIIAFTPCAKLFDKKQVLKHRNYAVNNLSITTTS